GRLDQGTTDLPGNRRACLPGGRGSHRLPAV
ncbi:hypothetical protein, partial [Arthrobacter sp. DR-2P]